MWWHWRILRPVHVSHIHSRWVDWDRWLVVHWQRSCSDGTHELIVVLLDYIQSWHSNKNVCQDECCLEEVINVFSALAEWREEIEDPKSYVIKSSLACIITSSHIISISSSVILLCCMLFAYKWRWCTRFSRISQVSKPPEALFPTQVQYDCLLYSFVTFIIFVHVSSTYCALYIPIGSH